MRNGTRSRASALPDDPTKSPTLTLIIDTGAATRLFAFDGNVPKVSYLKAQNCNVAHYIRPNSRVLVVGAGGGRDILSALAFDQRSVLGVEINEDILRAVNERFGDYTGHLDKNPKVTFVNDEARSYITRSKHRFDIIQISFIDTWAATAAGAFVLSENSLYTVEAWKVFFDHLTPEGILTVSRWYFRDSPGEMYRVTALASTALMQRGIKNPRDHIVVIRQLPPGGPTARPDGLGTILVCAKPFSDRDLKGLEAAVRTWKFEIALSPKSSVDPIFERIATGGDLERLQAELSINIRAPTDNSPFFFICFGYATCLTEIAGSKGSSAST